MLREEKVFLSLPDCLSPGYTLTKLKKRINQLGRSRLQRQCHRETIGLARKQMMLENFDIHGGPGDQSQRRVYGS